MGLLKSSLVIKILVWLRLYCIHFWDYDYDRDGENFKRPVRFCIRCRKFEEYQSQEWIRVKHKYPRPMRRVFHRGLWFYTSDGWKKFWTWSDARRGRFLAEDNKIYKVAFWDL